MKLESKRVWAIGIDPGLATLGVAIVAPAPAQDKIVRLVFARTWKQDEETPAAGLQRRADEIETTLFQVFGCEPAVAFIEEFSFLRAAQPNAMLSRAWGMIQTHAKRTNTPLVQVRGAEVKRIVAGTKNAEKQDLQHKLWSLYPDARERLAAFSLEDREHPADALAIYHAGAALHAEDPDPRFDALRALRLVR